MRFLGIHIQRLWHRHATLVHLVLSLAAAYFVLNWVFGAALWGKAARSVQPGASLRQSAEWLRMLEAWNPGPTGSMHLMGTLTSDEGDNLAIVQLQSQRRTVRTGESLGDGFMVVEVGPGRMVIKRDDDVQIFQLSSRLALSHPGHVRSSARADLLREAAVAMLSELDWQAVPVGGGFVALRVAGAVPRHVADAFGLTSGDVLEAVNGLPVPGGNELERLHERFRNDELVTLGLRRGQRRLVYHVTLHD